MGYASGFSIHQHRVHNDKSAWVVGFVGHRVVIRFRLQHQVGSFILICDSVRNNFFPLLQLADGICFFCHRIFFFRGGGFLEYWLLFLFGIVLVGLKIFVFFTMYLRRI